MRPGMMPILHLPGEITPGQLGPIKRVFLKSMVAATRTMSMTGMPSVMQMIRGISASAASRMASAAYGGGTKITDAFAPVDFTASVTVSNTGRSRCSVPPLPGVTPPTTLVPYWIICCAWKVPSRPVKPWTMRRVFSSTRTLIAHLPREPLLFVRRPSCRRR